MLRTYKAILHGDRVEWIEKPPERTYPVQVHITLLDDVTLKASHGRGQDMVDALTALSNSGAFSAITDPVSWQRGVRHERPLLERDV